MSEKKFQFDTAMTELEAITQWFESGDVNLDQGLTKFERGMELATQLKEHLALVENRVEKIKVKFATPSSQKGSEPSEQPLADDDLPVNFFD